MYILHQNAFTAATSAFTGIDETQLRVTRVSPSYCIF